MPSSGHATELAPARVQQLMTKVETMLGVLRIGPAQGSAQAAAQLQSGQEHLASDLASLSARYEDLEMRNSDLRRENSTLRAGNAHLQQENSRVTYFQVGY